MYLWMLSQHFFVKVILTSSGKVFRNFQDRFVLTLIITSLQHIADCNDERNGVSNHWRLDGSHNRLFRHRSKKTSKLRVTGLCEGNPPVTDGFPSQRARNAKNASIWWRHHVHALVNWVIIYSGKEQAIIWIRLIKTVNIIPLFKRDVNFQKFYLYYTLQKNIIGKEHCEMYPHVFAVTHQPSGFLWCDSTWALFQYLELSERSEIWQAHRQHCCRCACQIAKRWETRLWDLTRSYR